MDDGVFFYHDLLEGTEKSIRKDGVLWTETEDLGHCLALCALSVSKIILYFGHNLSTFSNVAETGVFLFLRPWFDGKHRCLLASKTFVKSRPASYSLHIVLYIFAETMYSITLLKRTNKIFVSNPEVLPYFTCVGIFWTTLQLSTLEHIMSLSAKQSAAIYFRFRPLIAKFICFQLWCNLAVLASGKHTHTHTVALFSCSCVCAEVRTPCCSEQCGGLMRSTVSLRHVHTYSPTEAYVHAQHEI